MRVFITILLIIALKVYSSINIRGEPFPKPKKELQEDFKPKNKEREYNALMQKIKNMKNFRPSPPSLKRLSDEKILSK